MPAGDGLSLSGEQSGVPAETHGNTTVALHKPSNS